MVQLWKCKEERDRLDAENLKLHEQTADLNLAVQTLREEIESLRLQNQNLMQATQNSAANSSQSNDDRQQLPSVERLQEVRDRILEGTRSDKLKATSAALDKFISLLTS